MSEIPFIDSLRYQLTRNNRTEDFYRNQYQKIFERFYNRSNDCLEIGKLRLPVLSHEKHPTREEAYYAMEIGDILYPALLGRYHYTDEGPYEWGDVMIRDGDVVFDCGANLGVFSILAASKGAEVYAFEPIREARKILQKTLELNPDIAKNVTVVPYAVSDTPGKATFTILEDTLVGSSMVLNQKGRQETVPVTTIDAFCTEKSLTVDFIKADIEGSERRMLAGAKDAIRNQGPKISVCTYHLPDDPEIIRDLILKANPHYRIVEKWKKIYADL
ncbi:MAG TPA: FkbM family methyltransferase [Methanocorpusculum sp.]|nr:FkbM family methyltransferase [Methanocorpusculum sp.]HKL98132.1 FkbM family methyltransferase [Methanocorpusculum sp.]